MSVLRFDPFRDFDRLVAEQIAGLRGAPRSVPMDAYRRGDQFLVHLDLPGVDPDAIELTVEQNVLSIKAERRFEPEEGDERWHPPGIASRRLAESSLSWQGGGRHGPKRYPLTAVGAIRCSRRIDSIGKTDAQNSSRIPADGTRGMRRST